VFVAASGLGSGRVVLFLHPLGLDHTMWESQQTALGDELHLLMPDLPGCGQSRLEECGVRPSVEACAECLRHRGKRVPNDAMKTEKRHLVEAARELAEIDLMSSLPQITAPTVVFAPSRDWFVRRHAAQVAAAIPGASLTPVPGAGHLWTERRPAPLTECVRTLSHAARA
jgi:pimeloyl-ACP methyl ester carboxylesterase